MKSNILYKRILTVLLLAIGGLFCLGFTWNLSKETLVSKLKNERYQRDATRLALRLLSSQKDYQSIEVEVPYELVNSIYDALLAIDNSDLKESRLVTDLHKLHTFPVPSVDNFLVIYERNSDWATPLRLGDCSTTNPEINKLCAMYSLEINNNIEWDDEHNSFNVRAARGLNLMPIASSFTQIEGISKVDMLTPNGDGNDIEVKKDGDDWIVSYIIKFDSCFKQCQKQHIWKFKVKKSGSVEFIEEFGDELPKWMKRD